MGYFKTSLSVNLMIPLQDQMVSVSKTTEPEFLSDSSHDSPKLDKSSELPDKGENFEPSDRSPNEEKQLEKLHMTVVTIFR